MPATTTSLVGDPLWGARGRVGWSRLPVHGLTSGLIRSERSGQAVHWVDTRPHCRSTWTDEERKGNDAERAIRRHQRACKRLYILPAAFGLSEGPQMARDNCVE